MICEIMNAAIQVTSKIEPQAVHPVIVCSFMCLEPLNALKKTNLPVTLAYKHPKKTIVGTMKEKETFLYSSSSEPKAGEVMYWLPV